MFSPTHLRLLRDAPQPPHTSDTLWSGVPWLDELLQPHGLIRGHITEWVGGSSSGKTTALGLLVDRLRACGASVAWVDGGRTLMASDWAHELPGLLWVVRPPKAAEATFCAEMLLRTHSFDVVILDGAAEGPSPSTGTRLQRLARQGGSALVVVRDPSSPALPSRCRVSFERAASAGAPLQPLHSAVEVRRTRGGAPQPPTRAELREHVGARRLSSPIAPDRATRHGARRSARG